MVLNDKPLFSVARWTPAWRLPEFNTLIAILLASGMVFAFAKIADEMVEGETRGFDESILLALRQPGDPSRPIGPWWLEAAMIDITSLGGWTVLTLVTIATLTYLVISGRRGSAGLVVASIFGGTLLSVTLKIGFARPRPELVDHLVHVSSASFPSGHAMLSAVTYLTLGVMLARTESRRLVRGFIFGVAAFLTLVIGLSRIYLGVHYPTDVLAGWCLGACWALICWMGARWLRPKGDAPEQG
ncbi:phosphatase PAP2 family protein [Methylopila turkensis]|uniref:Phosphatase PAP2 family protein n=1 Tax=Methylopila turkensis TaxID=1437816 RepID=A0A9W6N7E9_9HYPH|nr:phosphatase PAP2 family protein [Methylopila turkensis]GLK81174.1 phosphatase PAP2 family protein [Methylopila turkensis]